VHSAQEIAKVEVSHSEGRVSRYKDSEL